MAASFRLAVGVLTAAVGVPASAQTVNWRLASSHGIAECQMVFDAARNRFVAVGQWPSLRQPFATSEWDGTGWRARQSLTAPSQRSGFGLAYDVGRGRVVLFGGQGSSGGQGFDDTWEYDGLDWIARTPALRPSARRLAAMTWDLARGCVMLAGGTAGSTPLTDSWTWNGTTWQSVPPPIPALAAVAMASHPSTGRVVLVGNRGTVAETWTYDGVAWTQAAAASTPWGQTYRATTDGARDRIVLLAADSATPWQWTGSAWSALAAPFDGRRDGGLAADGAGQVLAFAGQVLVSGGLFGTLAPRNDTWRIADTGHVRLDEGGPNDMTLPQIAWDALRARIVCVGLSASTAPNATWEYDGAAWHALATPTPSATIDSRMCFDLLRGRAVRFGGARGSLIQLQMTAELSEWDGTQWRLMTAPGPAGRWNHAMTYDLTRGVVLLFGGSAQGVVFGDTWQWNGTAWTRLAVTGPLPRERAAMAFDPLRASAVLFGGVGSGNALGDTWEWDGAVWVQRTASPSPRARQRPLLDYDFTRQRTVLIGGVDGSGTINDLWEWDGSSWRAGTTSLPDIAPSPVAVGVIAGDHWLLVSTGATWLGSAGTARTSVIGTGCGGATVPALRADGDPVLGSTAFAVELHRATPNSYIACAFAAGQANTPLGGGCTLYLPQLDQWLLGSTGASGYALVRLPVPALPALQDLDVSLQAGVLDGSTPLGFALSNAVVAHLGR